MFELSEMILMQEKQGQIWLCSQNPVLLPHTINDVKPELLKEIGIRLGEHYDDIFAYAELPEGWSVVPNEDHDMWNYVIDAEGYQVLKIFYKASMNDRRAQLMLAE